MKIMLVDDEPSILASTAMLLTDLGHEVVTTSDHSRVVRLLNAERPDVLLQDVRMPGLDIAELLAGIRGASEVEATPVVLFSAGADVKALGEKLGLAITLEKPFKPDDLMGAIEAAVASSERGHR